MNPTIDYQIIYKGMFDETDFSFEILPGKRKYEANTRKLINKAWLDARLNPDINIYNGPVISLISIEYTPRSETGRDRFTLKVQTTDYKSFYGTNVCNTRILPKQDLSNAMAACAAVETREGTIFVGKRNKRLAETSGVWHVPGGTFNEVINPIALMKKELSEELNVTQSDIQYAICLGFGENLIMKKPEFLCYFHLNLTEKQLSDKMLEAKDKDEHSEQAFVPMEELEHFVNIHPFAPIGKACVSRYLEYVNEL
jgi:ADP-ribose pyrophosphatase YjhB (NUDIX family)